MKKRAGRQQHPSPSNNSNRRPHPLHPLLASRVGFVVYNVVWEEVGEQEEQYE